MKIVLGQNPITKIYNFVYSTLKQPHVMKYNTNQNQSCIVVAKTLVWGGLIADTGVH